MTLEEIKYYSILLGVGEFEEFKLLIKNAIDGYQEIDDILAELLFESDNMAKCCDILSESIRNKKVDDAMVSYKLICFVKGKLDRGQINRTQAIELFVRFAKEATKYNEDKIEEPWATMKLLEMILDKNNKIIYDSDLDNFLNYGKILTEHEEIQEKLSKLFG